MGNVEIICRSKIYLDVCVDPWVRTSTCKYIMCVHVIIDVNLVKDMATCLRVDKIVGVYRYVYSLDFLLDSWISRGCRCVYMRTRVYTSFAAEVSDANLCICHIYRLPKFLGLFCKRALNE